MIKRMMDSHSPIRSRTGFMGMTELARWFDKSNILVDRRACPRENGERLSYVFYFFLFLNLILDTIYSILSFKLF